jgi:SAM-dependent methyltransferase
MHPQKNKRIKRLHVQSFAADRKEYCHVLEDMLRNSGDLIPDPNWLELGDVSRPADTYDKNKALQIAMSEEAFNKQCSQLDSLLKAWIGSADLVDERSLLSWRPFIKGCDLLKLWESNIIPTEDSVPLFYADLGSIMDLNLIYAFSFSENRKVTRILEVGGGYGRLAEAAFNIFGRSVKYVIVDAVPASLYYSKHYLKQACPDARVGSFYDHEGPTFELDRYDISIVPAWYFEKINTDRYDVCVNIESFQEMNQHHVDYYLNLFDKLSATGATIYISNARDYYFRGRWNYPPSWQKLFCANTPRSWTRDHPTEIFRKTGEDLAKQNSVMECSHQYLSNRESPEAVIENIGIKRLVTLSSRAVRKKIVSKLRSAISGKRR